METGWPDSMSPTPNLGGTQRLLLDPERHQMLMSLCLDQGEEKPRLVPAYPGLPGVEIRPQQAASLEHILS